MASLLGTFHMSGQDDTCPKCGCKKIKLKNYSMMWHDGDVHCAKCDTFIRFWDAG